MMRHLQSKKHYYGILAIRVALVVCAAVLFLAFFSPIVYKGVLNIGNVTGMAVSFLIGLYGILLRPVNRLIRHIGRFLFGRILLGICVVILAAILGIVTAETVCMIRANTVSGEDETAILVVLGCKAHADHPSEMLQTRLDAAIRYLNEHPGAKAVLSGGRGADEPVTEAQCMYDYLTRHGIAGDRLYQEERSTDTRENLQYTVELLREKNLPDNVVILTNEFHMYRATRLAKHMDLSYGVYTAHTPLWALPTYYVRELYGILRDWILQ